MMSKKVKTTILAIILIICAWSLLLVVQRTNVQKAYEKAEIEKEKKAQEASRERAKHQGTSGLGRSSWGDF